MSFSNKVVIVTGASSGIGAATAKHFVREGADVVVIGRNQEKLSKVEEQCKALGKAPLIIKADVANDDDAKRIIKQTIDKYGKLDVLVNNAGIAKETSVLGGELLQKYDEIVNINLRAVVHLTSLAAPHLVKTKGNIVNISSGAATSLFPNIIAYSTSKAGLNHFSRGAASELAAHGVRVNIISPGPVVTDILDTVVGLADNNWEEAKNLTALKRVSQPEEVANLIAFLASDAAKGITGSDYVIDNGAKVK